ncbi:MAG: AAA family ATPase [Candidatus Omnitrophica bacterium]|nr:AAA family ATPase [Candidatus Omnitrophota bacterium]
MKKGVVIGKFYPPHKGHKYLLETALSQVNELAVIVCDRKDQKIPGKLRADWIKEMVPQVKVIVIEDSLPEYDSKLWADYTIKVLGYTPDVVFTSEEYGDRYAQFMGCKHVLVDINRCKFPVSATQIRANPMECWDYLAPCVRAYFAKKICVLGAESSGTTTITRALAKHYRTVWVPEFGRIYSQGKMLSSQTVDWHTEEFIFIANKQNEMEDHLALLCDKIIFCDTDSFATSLWHERYMGFMSSEVDKINVGRNYELYLLTDIDIPFIQDGLRDGINIRKKMHKRFKEELERRNKPYVILSGSHNDRLKKAIELCDNILSKTAFP